jgi:hypothetical protein
VRLFVGGIAVQGPGLVGWPASRAILAGGAPYEATSVELPLPAGLPPNERRRTSAAIRLALAAAGEAVSSAGLPAGELMSVFASGNGDGAIVSSILEALSRPQPVISPTQFHNSVHNAPAAYWTIATGCMESSTSLGGHDASFAVGLLHAAAKALANGWPVLLCAYDLPFPMPLDAARPTTSAFAIAMLLSPERLPWTVAALDIEHVPEPPTYLPRPSNLALQSLHAGNPAARALPLLELLAVPAAGCIHLDLQGGASLTVGVTPC